MPIITDFETGEFVEVSQDTYNFIKRYDKLITKNKKIGKAVIFSTSGNIEGNNNYLKKVFYE